MAYPFRIEAPSPIRANAAESQAPFQAYMDRLIKLIPAEIIGVYLTVRGFWMDGTPVATTPGSVSSTFLGFWPVVCVVLLWVTRGWGTRAPDGSWKSVQIVPIALATVSFLIWIYAIGDAVFGVKPDPRLISTAVVVWVFLVPVFYKGS